MTLGKRILVVDDDPPILSFVTEALEAEGYQVEPAVNGQDALNKVQQRAPHAILLDLMMPVLDGWQLITALRTDPTTSQIPIIVLSAADAAANHPALESVVVVAKPFDLNMLLILLEDAVESPADTVGKVFLR
jgi:two-component system, chemotaxis family, chemotaxis protein CheY